MELEPDPFDSLDDEGARQGASAAAGAMGGRDAGSTGDTDEDSSPAGGEVTPWESPSVSDDSVAIADPKPRTKRPPRKSAALTDMVIYALAGAVLALSALGLWWLGAR